MVKRTPVRVTSEPDVPALEAGTGQNWYAIYTAPRHEKTIARHLARKSVECFLPLYKEVRRWKNGRNEVQLPLFPGYIFVHVAWQEHLPVLVTAGVLRFVGFGQGATPLDGRELQRIRQALDGNLELRPHPDLVAGERVRIVRGPLRDIQGIVAYRQANDGLRVVISLHQIMRSVSVEVDAVDIEPIPNYMQ